jgi:hypothetical protein
MKRLGQVGLGILIAGLCGLPTSFAQQGAPEHVLDSDDLFWVPTLDQAVEMAKATGKPIFSMGYSLVPDGTTYTKKGDTCPKGVF